MNEHALLISYATGTEAGSWLPMPDLAALDIAGTITARMNIGGGESGDAGFSAGVAMGFNGWLNRPASPDAELTHGYNITAVLTVDYISDPLEIHLTAAVKKPCPPEAWPRLFSPHSFVARLEFDHFISTQPLLVPSVL